MAITGIIVGGVVLVALIGVAAFVGLRVFGDSTETTGGDEGVVTITTEPLSTANKPFTDPVGIDQPVTAVAATTPTPTPTAAATVAGGEPGLYGGTLNTAQCDKAKLVSFLQTNPAKAAAWAGVEGISVDQIPGFVNGLTPMLLTSDTLVVNHGFENGQATAFTAVLEAGTAVMVNDRGVPVVKCYCGNPLGIVPTPPTRVKYTGPTWTGFTPTNYTIIQQNPTVVTSFTVTNITNNTTFVRVTGSDGTKDQPTGAASTPPAPTTPAPATPAPMTQAPTAPAADQAEAARVIVRQALDACATADSAYAADPSAFQLDITPLSQPGLYRAAMSTSGGVFEWTVNTSAGTLTPANQQTSEFAAEYCPSLDTGG